MDIYTVLWDGKKLNKDFFIRCQENETLAVVQYNVKKSETVKKDLSRLRVMMDSLSEIGQYARQQMLCLFDGYDHDSRELAQIPEVVAYIKQIVQEYPFIFYFLHAETNLHVVSCIVKHTLISSPLLFTQGKKYVQLDITAANEMFRTISDAVRKYGVSVGDERGARAAMREWRQALNL